MDFVSNQGPQIKAMLEAIGVSSIAELFREIPKKLLHAAPESDDGMSEAEVTAKMEHLAALNSYPRLDSYLGAGAYAHHVPALVGAITSRSEFLTSYTPYQPEISQGMLQVIFEFQTAIAALTGMQAANASVYDGASACAEAVLMACRVQKEKKKVLMAASLNPFYQAVVKQYLLGLDFELVTLPFQKDGTVNYEIFQRVLDTDTAAVLLQSPNVFGVTEEMSKFNNAAKANQALMIACGNPLSYGLFAPPGEYGADIAVGDCQPLGLALNYGGPYAGYMACQEQYIRQLPGRIVGQTVDLNGNKGFVLTLQAREQHIRREKATSNICTNQALASLAALIAMLWYGPVGLKKLALTNYQRAHYLQAELSKINQFSSWKSAFFNEFVLEVPCKSEDALAHFRKSGIEAGVALNRFYPEFDQHLLVAVTELKTLSQLNRYIEVAKAL